MFATTKYTPFTTLSIATGYFCKSEFGNFYGFNGQEQDNEVAGTGNIMTAEFWMYDGRLGRRWNVDPLSNFWESPYCTFNSNPNFFSDKNGAKPLPSLYNILGRIGTSIKNIFSKHKQVWGNHNKPSSPTSNHTRLSGFLTGLINFVSGHHYSAIPSGDWDTDDSPTVISLLPRSSSSTKVHRKFEFNTDASDMVINKRMSKGFDRSRLENFTFAIIKSGRWPILSNFPSGIIPLLSSDDPITWTWGASGLTGVGQIFIQLFNYLAPTMRPGAAVLALDVYGLQAVVNLAARRESYFQLDIYAIDPSIITDLNVQVQYKRFSRYGPNNRRPLWHKWVYGVAGGGG
jgi:hypothetical protein